MRRVVSAVMQRVYNQGMSEHESHPDQEEVARLADQILDTAKENQDLPALEDEDSQAAVRFAADIAEAHLKYGRSGGVESARAVYRQVAADTIAPEAKIERDEAKRALKVDHLTGLANDKAFDEALPSAEQNSDVCFVSFDGDNFGSLNKDHHNAAGNAAIILLAESITKAAEAHGTNRVFRTGGDEFYVLASPDQADAIIADAKRILSERLHSGEPLPDEHGNSYPLDWYSALGVSGFWADTRNEADEQMYKHKKAAKAKAN